ncbi:hypothetical protein [Microbacterium rhizomatis]|uniref:Uncharacterized protein n=1 Tax=Microbacterium rhizomatis TaxID=1631477 RepID=A0A5J5IW53_9MICO|nr:hypothetical protein [Microbacterium rhizomatis]KAA9104999.1 hypothetical protein F6B43_18295 [Microbacterium rhizomatis]
MKPFFLPTQLIILWIIALGGLASGVITALVLASKAGDYYASETDLAALATWSNFLVIVGVIALVGALMLSGVREMMRVLGQRPSEVATTLPHTDADGL